MVFITISSDYGSRLGILTIPNHYGQNQDAGEKCKLTMRYANWQSELLKLMNPSRHLDNLQDPWSLFHLTYNVAK